MSGPIVPPLEVTEVDGSPDGRPITKIIVSNGDLSISGRTATIDTSGSGGTPAAPADSIQFNSDPAGTFTSDAGFIMSTIGGGDTTIVKIGGFLFGGNTYGVVSDVLNGSVTVAAEGTGQIFLQGTGDAGGTWSDTIANVLCWDDADDATLRFKNNNGTAKQADITLNGSLDLIIDNTYAGGGNIEVLPGTGKYVKIGGGAAAGTLTSNGAFDLQLSTNSGTNSGTITIEDGVNGTIELVPNGTGLVKVPNLTVGGTYAMPTDAGTDTYVMTTDGAGTASWAAAGGGGASTLGELTDVKLDDTNFVNSLLIQTNSDGLAPTTGTLNNADNNIGIGVDVLQAVTQGSGIVALGWNAAKALTSGAGGVFIGQDAGAAGSPAACVLIGANSGKTGVGSAAIHIGNSSGKWATGASNTCVGPNSGENLSGSKNCAFGDEALLYVSSGAGNIGIGSEGGASITTGDYNVIIGKATPASATADSQLSISNGSDGTVVWIVGDDAGACYQGDNATTWSTTSDRRLKHQIVDSNIGLDSINAVRVRNFRYIEKAEPITEIRTDAEGAEREAIVGYDGENSYNLDPEPLRVGVIAQELEEVFPDAVKQNGRGHLTVNTDSLNWALIKAVQELSAKVEALEANQ